MNLETALNSLPIIPASVKTVTEALNEPHRKYHNVDHVERMLNLAVEEGYDITKDTKIFEAIVFHDVVYQPTSTLNEKMSTLVYRGSLNSKVDFHRHFTVIEAILATMNHTEILINMWIDDVDFWINDFLDYDLEGLANNFYDNGRKIYAEFSPYVTDEAFFDGRLEFFRKMINSERIFRNHPDWEEKARENIQGEIDRMESMLTVDGDIWSSCEGVVIVNARKNYVKWMTMHDD